MRYSQFLASLFVCSALAFGQTNTQNNVCKPGFVLDRVTGICVTDNMLSCNSADRTSKCTKAELKAEQKRQKELTNAVRVSVPSLNVVSPRIFLEAESYGPWWNAKKDKTMEMSRDFSQTCSVKITLNRQTADYTLRLNHLESGLIARHNEFQLADKNGDVIATMEVSSIANTVQNVCRIIYGQPLTPDKHHKKDKT